MTLYRIKKQWTNPDKPHFALNDLYRDDELIMHAAGNAEVYDYCMTNGDPEDEYQEFGMIKPVKIAMMLELEELDKKYPVLVRGLTEAERHSWQLESAKVLIKYGRVDCMSEYQRKFYITPEQIAEFEEKTGSKWPY